MEAVNGTIQHQSERQAVPVPPAQPPAWTPPRVRWRTRLRLLWVRAWQGSSARPRPTLGEMVLAEEAGRLREELANERARAAEDRERLANTILRLETELRMRSADVDAARHEIELLALIHERDRQRVEADTAAYSQKIAAATVGRSGRGEG